MKYKKDKIIGSKKFISKFGVIITVTNIIASKRNQQHKNEPCETWVKISCQKKENHKIFF